MASRSSQSAGSYQTDLTPNLEAVADRARSTQQPSVVTLEIHLHDRGPVELVCVSDIPQKRDQVSQVRAGGQ